ncbi:MAG: class I SAM-dependent methyltransferase [Bacteroidales bacterium]|nr:class I SAM-dependent methyltransferase [Bacteroidales bacterium]
MQYDPIKRSLGSVFNRTPFLRKVFYRLLDLLLLRSWHIRKEIKSWNTTSPADAKILDAGSGFGQYDFYLSSLNPAWKILGVDVKEEQIADCNNFFKAINRPNVTFTIGDLTTYTEAGHYDLILSVDVMEHILEDVKVFENFHASLKPGGMLLISTPSDQGGSDVHDHDEEESFIEEHVRDGYNIQEIQEKLKKAGFSRTEARYQYGKPGQTAWRLSMKYPILMLGKSKLFFIILPFYYLFTYPFSYYLNRKDVNTIHASGTGLVVKAWK